MIDFSLLFFQEKKAHECLKKMLGDNGTPNIEFNAWVVGNPPRRSFSAGLPTPTNAFLWFDTLSGNWVCFCGNFWSHGTKPHFPEVGGELRQFGWKECGFAINSSFPRETKTPPDRAKSFKCDGGDYLEVETDGEFFWFDITPQNRANETLQTVSMKKDTFLKMVEYLKNVVDWL